MADDNAHDENEDGADHGSQGCRYPSELRIEHLLRFRLPLFTLSIAQNPRK